MRIALRILNSKLPNYQLVTCQPGESPQLTSFSQKKTKAWRPGPQLPAQSGSASPPRPSWQSFEISVHWARGAEIHGFNLSQFRNPNSEEDF